MPTTYDIPEVGAGTEPLEAPDGLGHAGLHDRLKAAVDGVDGRVVLLEDWRTDAEPALDQAKLTAHTWFVPSTLSTSAAPIGPALSNLTGREVEFESARITVFTAPTSGSVQVDLRVAAPISDGSKVVNFALGSMTSILNAPLSIAVGENTSDQITLADGDFAQTMMALNSWVCPVILAGGGGANLTIQLNRNL